MGVGGQRPAPAALPPGKRPGSHCIGCWVGPRAGTIMGKKIRILKLTICTLKCPDDPNREGAMQGIYSMYVEIRNVYRFLNGKSQKTIWKTLGSMTGQY
jgi:hypothetical protein